jgi:hypothetical protein
VSELIDQTMMTWKRELPQVVFLPMDFEIVKNVPLST